MKLEIGMYVRFKDKKGATYIRKLTKLANEYPQKLYGMEIDEEANYSPYLSLKNILKASNNIIDLIAENDFVNNHRVIQVDRESLELYIENSMYGCGCENINDSDIKTIVTKEQFESMSYKVEG